MDGIHDLGGMAGFGAVAHAATEAPFADDWERRAFSTTLALLAALRCPSSAFRHSIERMDPAHYLAASYYEHWLTGAATLAVEAGAVTREELERRAGGGFPLSQPALFTPPAPPPAGRTEPRFAVGDRVRVRDRHPSGHTRTPRYVRGKRGAVVRVDVTAPLPDLEAHGAGRVLDPTYAVRFEAAELWGDEGRGESVVVGVWEYDLQEDT